MNVTNYGYKPDTKEWYASDFKGVEVGKSVNFLVNLKRKLTDAPKNVLAKAAARLREIYRKWLMKANQEHDSGKQAWYKKIARKFMQAVDWIMRKIENMHVNNYERAKRTAEKFYNAGKWVYNKSGRKIVGTDMKIDDDKKGINNYYTRSLDNLNKAYEKDNQGKVKYN